MALAAGGRFADLSQSGRARPGDLTEGGQQHAFAAALDAEHGKGLAGSPHFGPVVGRPIETTHQAVRSSLERERGL